MKHEIRKTGDGKFYLVGIDKDGNSKGFYVAGKLLRFDASEDAKLYLETRLKPENIKQNVKQKGGKEDGGSVEEISI